MVLRSAEALSLEEEGAADDGGGFAVEGLVPERVPDGEQSPSYLFILPVLFVEFLAIAVTRSLLPGRLNDFFGDRVYVVMGVAETVKGLLAFGACPLFGKLSDLVGRGRCLVVTVFGTTAPCWVLAFTDDLWVYATALGLSGMFAATFTLVFAYISDVVPADERAPAYGLALATLGLSFTVGPPLGAFAARKVGQKLVFLVSLALSVFDVLFIFLALPETRVKRKDDAALFDPSDTVALFRGDPLLARLAVVVLLYYSGVWALVTTLVIYVVRVFAVSATQVGWLLGTYGLSTMVAEAGLVRVVLPRFGERQTIRLGLAAFALQCAAIALARTPTLVWASIVLSLLSNLVYPAVSSLVSRSVPSRSQGEALGAINGVKAVTEGAGPLAFATLMATFEKTSLPGLPYLACSLVALLAIAVSFHLPADDAYASFRATTDAKHHELVSLLEDHDDPSNFGKAAPTSSPLTVAYAPGLTTSPSTFTARSTPPPDAAFGLAPPAGDGSGSGSGPRPPRRPPPRGAARR